MKLENQSQRVSAAARPSETVSASKPPASGMNRSRERSKRFRNFSFFALILSLLFAKPLLDLVGLALASKLHSHILLIPFTFAYLVYLRRDRLSLESPSSIRWSIPTLLLGLGALLLALGGTRFSAAASPSNHLALIILALVSFLSAGGVLILGTKWMRELIFPFAFLIFLVPLPDEIVYRLEVASQVASADAAQALFAVSGTPILRDGMVFQLPGMFIRVAQECSGIRSSLVLFITSLVAAHLFLENPWRRFLLVAFVIPLGILRNGLRIFTIGWLCIHYGPQMIDSAVHRQGGPFFFSLSLIPLFFLLWWLRSQERRPIAVQRGRLGKRS